MKKFKLYLIGWLVCLITFNIITFILPSWPNLTKYSPSFWIGYSSITLAFIGQLICSFLLFKENNNKKRFYNITLFKINYIGLISIFIVSMICMVLTPLPYWVSTILCLLVLAVNIIIVIKSMLTTNIISNIDEKVEKTTNFIYDMRSESESLLLRAKTEDVKEVCEKISNAFKYSDPMGSNQLLNLEKEIKDIFDIIKLSIKENNFDNLLSNSEELLALITERNNKCKRLK